MKSTKVKSQVGNGTVGRRELYINRMGWGTTEEGKCMDAARKTMSK